MFSRCITADINNGSVDICAHTHTRIWQSGIGLFATLSQKLSHFFDVRPGEADRIGVLAALLFLLLAANNLIKILRDSIFLGHHSASELPYLYILVALFAGVIIATYTRYTAHVSLVKLCWRPTLSLS